MTEYQTAYQMGREHFETDRHENPFPKGSMSARIGWDDGWKDAALEFESRKEVVMPPDWHRSYRYDY